MQRFDGSAMVPPLREGTCQVWWARPDDARPGLDHLLDREQRDRRHRLVRKDDQDRLTVGAAVARLVLARHLGRPAEQVRLDRTCDACGAQHGKPRLAGADAGLRFSVAHSGEWVAVAVVRGAPVGVDVERVTPGLDVEALASEVLGDDERDALDRLAARDRPRGLLTYWTRKEALLKATGDGLRVAMRGVAVSGPDDPPSLRRWPGPSELPRPVVLCGLGPGAGYLACLAVLGLPSVQVREIDAGGLLAAPVR